MKYLIFIALLAPRATLVDAIIQVESRGNDSAFNAAENAAGCLQIRPIMVREVNRLIGWEVYNLEDRWDREKSIEMFEVIKNHVEDPTGEKIARIWNGGWQGHTKASTIPYWEKVKEELR